MAVSVGNRARGRHLRTLGGCCIGGVREVVVAVTLQRMTDNDVQTKR